MSILFLLDNVYKRYQQNNNYYYILDNINLEIKKGLITLVKGSIGSGKTTILNILSLLDNDYMGDVYYNGVNVLYYKKKERDKIRLSDMGIVFQEHNLLPNLNIYQNIKLGNKNHKKKEDLNNIIKLFNLENILLKNINEVSGGERQRVSIARALLKTTDVLILDEPTSSLDKDNCFHIMSMLKNINDIYKTTIIIATHDSMLDVIGDIVITIEDGKVVTS